MALRPWRATAGTARGRVVLVHGLSSTADSWWRMGPALDGEPGWAGTDKFENPPSRPAPEACLRLAAVAANTG